MMITIIVNYSNNNDDNNNSKLFQYATILQRMPGIYVQLHCGIHGLKKMYPMHCNVLFENQEFFIKKTHQK